MFKLVLVGGVDHGKSTLLGRLAHETGACNLREDNQPTSYAYYADSLTEEREGEFTLDTTQMLVDLGGRRTLLIDVPGHTELIKNMVTGASQAEVALVVVDAERDLLPDARKHLAVLQLLEIRDCVVAVNKVDAISYDPERFRQQALAVASVLADYDIRPYEIVPVSALTGDNISRRSSRLCWYQGPTLCEAIGSMPSVSQAGRERVRFLIQDQYSIDGRAVHVGRVETGYVSRGQRLAFYPGARPCTVRSIEKFGEPQMDGASAGDCVGLVLEDDWENCEGYILAPAEDPPIVTRTLRVTLMNLSGEPLEEGMGLHFQSAGFETECCVVAISCRVMANNGLRDTRPSRLHFSEIGGAVLSLVERATVERFRDMPSLGRFVLSAGNKTVAGGVVIGTDTGISL